MNFLQILWSNLTVCIPGCRAEGEFSPQIVFIGTTLEASLVCVRLCTGNKSIWHRDSPSNSPKTWFIVSKIIAMYFRVNNRGASMFIPLLVGLCRNVCSSNSSVASLAHSTRRRRRRPHQPIISRVHHHIWWMRGVTSINYQCTAVPISRLKVFLTRRVATHSEWHTSKISAQL